MAMDLEAIKVGKKCLWKSQDVSKSMKKGKFFTITAINGMKDRPCQFEDDIITIVSKNGTDYAVYPNELIII